MAANQYLVPGGEYLNEDTSALEFLVPGGSYINETSAAAPGGATTVFIQDHIAQGIGRGVLFGR